MSEFDSWYGPEGTGSGIGSSPAYTAGYRAFLERFMQEHDIRTVLDVGCGDWQFSRLVQWGDRFYVGQDVVHALVDQLNSDHGGPLRRFVTELPDEPFDLVICKDVMIHLPNAEVMELLERLSHHKHLLLVNDFSEARVDCERGHYRALDVTGPPFNLGADLVYTFPQLNNETKVVHHRWPR